MGFWISLILFGLYAFHVVEKLYYFHWLLAEFAYSLIWCLLLFVASILVIITGHLLIVAGVSSKSTNLPFFVYISLCLSYKIFSQKYIKENKKELRETDFLSIYETFSFPCWEKIIHFFCYDFPLLLSHIISCLVFFSHFFSLFLITLLR